MRKLSSSETPARIFSKGTGYILRVLNLMPEARRVTRAVYELKG